MKEHLIEIICKWKKDSNLFFLILKTFSMLIILSRSIQIELVILARAIYIIWLEAIDH